MPDHLTQRADGTTDVLLGGAITRLVVPVTGPLVPTEDKEDPGYPDVILDQRAGYNNLDADSVEEVEEWWAQMLAKHRPPLVPRRAEVDVAPYINHGRWVADCSCGGGMLCWTLNPRTCCLDCGLVYFVAWPDPRERSAAIRALAVRPDPRNWNWNPHLADHEGAQVETVEFLHRENLLMLGIKE